jgi:hypothetical protein
MSNRETEFPVPALQDVPVEVVKLQVTVSDLEGRLRKAEFQIMNLLAFKSNVLMLPKETL